MESTESRFAHLLQPIRELTKNWDIDVASELNDYLEELDEMCITFDGGKTRLNFAEAALLIQGSACIYSKKVELLHSLVYQTLEYINDKNKKRNKQAAAAQEGGVNGAESGHDGEDDAVFSPLDLDVSDESQDVDLSTSSSVAPLPPVSLIPPETSEKNKLPLISVKGEVLCSLKDFRINIFIPGDHQDMILLTLGSAVSRLLVDKHPPESLLHQDAAAPPVSEAVEEEFLPVDDGHMEQEEQQQEQQEEEHVQRQQAQRDVRTLRERRLDEHLRRKEETTPPAVNVWTLHDPYAVLGEDTPYRSGKCYRVPEGLDDGGKRKRKRPASLQDFRSWFRGTFDPPEHRLKNGPSSTELNYVYLSNMRTKLRIQRKLHRKAGLIICDEQLRRTFLQPEGVEPQQQGEEPQEGFRQPDLPVSSEGEDENSDNEVEPFPDDIPAEFAAAPDFICTETHRDELSYEDLVKLRVEQLVVNSRGYTQETALSQRVKEWEDQVLPELLLQEQRPVFDIHDYGDRIVEALDSVGRRRSLSSIVAGLDNYEACKYLLASLQLANDLTVAVDSSGILEDGLDSMGLTLLSTQRATERFKSLTGST